MRRRTQIVILVFLVALGAGAAAIVLSLQSLITQRLNKGGLLPPLELYSQGLPLSPGRRLERARLEEELRVRGFEAPRDYTLDHPAACAQLTGLTFAEGATDCFFLRDPALVVTWDEQGFIKEIFRGDPLLPTNDFALFPRLITQFQDGQPLLQQKTTLGEVPLACLQAVTAIEDREFLEHRGVSPTGTLRALLRNLRQGRFAEGGSTITQQLVKNFFLSSKKTLRRKLEEQALAVMLEGQLNKDQILEMYLNVIYMGQSGPFQVRGFGSAAQYYFDKPVARLELPECALLAAIINNPGRFNPNTHPDHARQRREQVLRKMNEFDMIATTEMNEALKFPLPSLGADQRRVNAPYFVASALKELENWSRDEDEGAKLYTSLDPDVQLRMTDTILRILPQIEKRIKKPSAQPLQTAMITVDLNTNQILGLVGGRDFRTTQFNRVMESHRQVGSIIKPFVYYPALKEGNPLTAVVDEPFEWKSGRQSWRPHNFEKQFAGPVPYFYALAESLNVPAARVGQLVGLNRISETLKSSGVTSEVSQLPSLTLGAFELSPLEVAQAYSTVARMGLGDTVHTLVRSENAEGQPRHVHEPAGNLNLDPKQTAVLIAMMQQTFAIGTARGARGLEGDWAGKTGTTSDTKDAWFAGFNGRLLTVVWVGYDDNTMLGLTGAGAALPLWTDLSRSLAQIYKPVNFIWPAGTESRLVSRAEILSAFPNLNLSVDDLSLVFVKPDEVH